MSERIGINDPDDWIGWWLAHHPSATFAGGFTRLATTLLRDQGAVVEVGIEILHFNEAGVQHEVEIRSIVEAFPGGRVLHVLSIRSEGDPLPPFTQT
jgi:hypothetical protein